MDPKLNVKERLALIKRVCEGKEKVARVCKEAGISRTLFYRWLNKYKKANFQVKSLAPKNEQGKQQLTPNQRLEMIKRVKAGEPVSQVCLEFGVSRVIFYRWKERYDNAPEGQKLEALWDKKPQVEKYYQQAPEEVEDSVLSVVTQYPELSTHKIVEFLPQVGGRPILGNHGVQNVLKRHNLTTYSQRLAYALEKRKLPFYIHIFQAIQYALNSLYSLSTRQRFLTTKLFGALSFGIFLGIVLLGTQGFFGMIGHAPEENKVGLIFASFALLSGSIFFIYSLKYYFTLALVLGFSRHSEESEQDIDFNNNPSTALRTANVLDDTINNITNSLKRVIMGKGYGVSSQSQINFAGGLNPNLDKVTLKSEPFVSIHLALYNEKKVVNRLLTACTSLTYENYEVVVVDDSTDETTQILADWQNHPRVRIIHRDSRAGFKGGALGEALKATDPKASFILVFDADFVPYPDTITQFLKYFQSVCGTLEFTNTSGQASNIAAIQGYQWHVLNKSENWITRGVRSEYAGSYVIERSGIEVYGGLKQIAGSVYMIRKDILDTFGWQTSITEDFQLTLRLYEAGYKVLYTPYVQAPAECVSTLKRLVRQRMRWAEGHSFNVKKMFKRLMFGKKNEHGTFKPSPLSLAEKLEFVYLSPYYLQAAFFLFGTFCWLMSEAVFKARLPFWTSLWGWSLVLTNLFALPLVNTVGLFLEESEEKDYLGILSFVGLSYLLVPFQAYASIKGFFEKEEGPWFRTPKTGRITDVFNRGRFYRWLSGILPGKQLLPAGSQQFGLPSLIPAVNPYLAIASSHNKFNDFRIKRKHRAGWIAEACLALLLVITTSLLYFSQNVQVVNATPISGNLKLGVTATGPAYGNSLENGASYPGGGGNLFQFCNTNAYVGSNNFMWFGPLLPSGGGNAIVPSGAYSINLAYGRGISNNNYLNYGVQLFLTDTDGTNGSLLLDNGGYYINNYNGALTNFPMTAPNTLYTHTIGSIGANQEISSAAQKRLAVRIYLVAFKHTSRSNISWLINNTSAHSELVLPANIQVPEIPLKIVFIIYIAIMPIIPALANTRKRKQNTNIFKEIGNSWLDLIAKLTGKGQEALDELPV